MNKFLSILLFIFFVVNIAPAQKNKKENKDFIDPDAALKEELIEYKKNCRVALKPYRYDGQKTTFFSYKSYEYSKEIEVATIQESEYRLSINSNGIHDEDIKLRIYDKPKNQKGRVLLYEREGVGGNEFTFETTKMLEILKTYKKEKGTPQEVVDILRLKKLYIDYIIPAVERQTESDEEGNESAIEKRGAIVVCIGYLNL